MEVKLGIIGAGRMGSVHAINAAKYTSAKIVAIADINKNAAESLAKQLGVNKIYSSYDNLIVDNEIDAVIITLPNNLHYDAIIKSIEAGKHVFCEKPLTVSVKEAEDITRKAEKADIKLQVGFNRRFDPSYEKAKEIIDQGLLGRIAHAHSNTYDPEPHSGWEGKEEISGGIFFTTCIHDFDLLNWLIGRKVKKVYAELRGTFGKDQSAVCLLAFENGAFATVKAYELCSYGHDVKTEVIGDKAAIRVEQKSSTHLEIFTKAGVQTDYPYWFKDRFKTAYIREIQEFISCILNDKNPRVNAYDGLNATKIAEAAKRSTMENRPILVE